MPAPRKSVAAGMPSPGRLTATSPKAGRAGSARKSSSPTGRTSSPSSRNTSKDSSAKNPRSTKKTVVRASTGSSSAASSSATSDKSSGSGQSSSQSGSQGVGGKKSSSPGKKSASPQSARKVSLESVDEEEQGAAKVGKEVSLDDGDFDEDSPEEEEDDAVNEEDDDEDDWVEDEESEEESYDDDELDSVHTSDQGDSSDGQESLSTISNETDPSDGFEMPETERATAQVLPEPPWHSFIHPCRQLVLACLLPVLLVCLALYAILKCSKILLQCVWDTWNCGLELVWLTIRIALSPFYIAWKLFMPEYIQTFAYEFYDARVGRRLRAVMAKKKRVEDMVADFPNVASACYLAAIETCLVPARRDGGTFCYWFLGRHVEELIMKPLYDSHINRFTAQRKKRAMDAQRQNGDAKVRAKKLAPKRARAKARARRERAKRLRQRRKMAALEITLVLPQTHDHGGRDNTIKLPDREPGENVTRTMIVERRYAVAVGFIWFMIGGIILIATIDGSKNERCVICEDHIFTIEGGEETPTGLKSVKTMRVCRHGQNRDCAFHLHGNQVIISIVVMGIGGLLLIYSLFLYKPKGNAAEAREKERKAKAIMEEANLGKLEKQEEPETLALRLIIEDETKPTLGRRVRGCYQLTCFYGYQQTCSKGMNPVLKKIFKFERKHKLRDRSIAFQEWMYWFAIGWLGSTWRLGAAGVSRAKSGAVGRTFTTLGGRVDHGFCHRLYVCCSASIFGRAARSCWKSLADSPCGKQIGTWINNSPFCQKALDKLNDLMSTALGSPRSPRHGHSIVSGGRRQARAGGGNTLEAILVKFGLDEASLQAAEAENKVDTDTATFGTGETLVKVQREAGSDEVDDGVVEERCELGGWDEEDLLDDEKDYESEDEGPEDDGDEEAEEEDEEEDEEDDDPED